MMTLNILIPVYNRDVDLVKCLDSIVSAFDIFPLIDTNVFVINDNFKEVGHIGVDNFRFYFEIYNIGENIGKMAAIQYFLGRRELSGSVVVLDSDDLVHSDFFLNIHEASVLSTSGLISFSSNLSKQFVNNLCDT
jgi:glycosyltransferase involved in cell wall biosynthesis